MSAITELEKKQPILSESYDDFKKSYEEYQKVNSINTNNSQIIRENLFGLTYK